MSKRIFQHPPETGTGPQYWRSLGQVAETPESKAWIEREFPTGASELNPDTSRRGFMKYMAASAALAGVSLSACRREEKLLVPFSQGVEWSIPGKPLFYTTSRPHRRGAQPIVVTTHEGRPTKIEGNPLHPASKGSTDIHSQTSLLDLYDPDRSKQFLKNGKVSDEKAFLTWLGELVAKSGDGAGIGFLTEHNTSPTFGRLKAELQSKMPGATWASYEPLSGDDARKAHDTAFGQGFRPVPQIDKADVILSLDCDFLGFDEGRLEGIAAFAARRRPEQKMNRLYVVENRYTVTGGMADHRMRCPVSKIGAYVRQLAEYIGGKAGEASLTGMVGNLAKGADTFDPKWISEVGDDLMAQNGKALVLIGYRQPAAVQLLVHGINTALGALGDAKTILSRVGNTKAPVTIYDLAAGLGHGIAADPKVAAGQTELPKQSIHTLVILGGNPVYNAPADLNWSTLQARAENVIRLGHYEDETTHNIGGRGNERAVTWQIPAAHYLEAWGDGRASDGSLVSQQPMILPLYGGWSEIQLLNAIATGTLSDGLELVQKTFEHFAAGITTENWAKFLHDGFISGSAPAGDQLIYAPIEAESLLKDYQPPKAGYEVVFVPCAKVDDGRYANNGWLQELPDPITKITWDNAALISPATAQKLGLDAKQANGFFDFDNGSWISIKANGATLEIPVYILPGHADDSISIALGYGRTFNGRVGGREGNYMSHGGFFAEKGAVGFNAYPMRTRDSMYFVTGAEVSVIAREKYPLAITQEHGAMEGRGADIIREGTAEQIADPLHAGFAKSHEFLEKTKAMDAHAEEFDKKGYPVARSAYSHPPLTNDTHQWGMAVDLTVCTGCSACMVACQSENNIPVVGKEQVIEGREMHWIRMDRYFVSEPNSRNKDVNITEPRMVMQPMPCQHCENAPCETVCPVNATVHSDDGLNVMAYNRCIGTRYCANNCPFKVRRFNFFDFNERQKDKYFRQNLINEKGMADSLKLSKNPNVTVRMRGVMEKCTFCVQRIQESKIADKVKAKDAPVTAANRSRDSFQVACQQACPTDAIVFGNMNDPESNVSKLKDNPRDYRLFDYLGIKPRVSYLARITNPNPKMGGAHHG